MLKCWYEILNFQENWNSLDKIDKIICKTSNDISKKKNILFGLEI